MNEALTCFRRKTRKRVLAALAMWSLLTVLPVSPAWALPQGGAAGGGSVSWQTVGDKMTVNQGSNRAVINWQTFSIGSQETVQFVQPGADAAILNRVTGPYSSEIFGSLLANGNVYLINPNGILFGAGSRINVGGLVASSFNLSDEDFNAGRLNFARLLNSGKVINQGTITAGAFAYLLGAGVENGGVIQAPAVALAAGRDKIVIDRTENGGEIRLSVDGDMPAISFAVSGDPAAMPNVVNEGVVDVSGETGGQAVLRGANVVQAGTLRADGTQGDGGRISLLGERLVALGGESETTANAGLDGDGGRIEVIAENFAGIYGGARIEARGGSLRGDGGFVETSGYQSFLIDAVPDVGAVNGLGGEWLIDPYNITIVSAGDHSWQWDGNDMLAIGVSAQIKVSDILTGLTTGDVTVRTGTGGAQDGDITVSADISYTAAQYANRTLTLEAADDIFLNANIRARADTGLGLTAGGDVLQGASRDIRLGTVTLSAGGSAALLGTANQIATLKGDVGGDLSVYNGISLDLDGLSVANGATMLTVVGNLTDTGANTLGDLTVTTTGNITLDADNDLGAVTANANGGAGAITLNDVAGTLSDGGLVLRDIDGGTLTVTAQDGDITQTAGTRVNVSGRTTLAADGQIDLFNPNNAFGGPVDADAAGIRLRQASGIELGDVAAGAGGLTVQADNGAITQTGDGSVSVGGETHLTARAAGNPADILLGNDANDFVGAVSADGANIGLTDGNGIGLGLVVAAGTLEVTALDGAITQTPDGVTAAGEATLAARGDITLDAALNDFLDTVHAAGANITLVDANGLELGLVSAGGTLDVAALAGAITQTPDGRVTAAGEATLAATGNIALGNAANDFDGAVNADGINIELTDSDGIMLGLVDAGGTLDVTALNGAITQTADGVTAAGEATLEAAGAGNNIVLNSAGNDFQATVNAYGRDIALTDGAGGLSVGRVKGKADPADGTAAGTVAVTALNGGGIADAQGDTVTHDAEGFAVQNGARTVNISADNLLLDAAGDIGGSGAPLDIEVGTLAARSSGGNVWLYETDALTIGTVSGVAGVSAAANAKVETIGGSLTVAQAVHATAGDILLAAKGAGADVSVQAAVGAADGNVTLLAANGVLQGAAGDLTAGASIDVEAKAGSVAMTDGASAAAGGNLRYFAAQNAAVTGLDGANVRVEAAAGSITDAGDALADVTAAAAQLVAGGSVGGAGGTESDDNTLALDTAVGTLAARAGTDGSIHVRNAGALTIGTVAPINVSRVALDDSAEPLAGAVLAGAEAGADLKIVNGTGDLTVSAAVTALDGDVLLRALGGSLVQDAVLSAGGLATLMASDALEINADITAGGDVTIEAAGGDLAQAGGTAVSGANIRLASSRDIALGSLTADDAVSVVAGRSITDANGDETANVTALRARLAALGGSIGAGTGAASDANLAAVDLAVGKVEAVAAGDLYLQSLNAFTVGGVGNVGVSRARFDSGTTVSQDADLTGLSAGTGVAKVKSAGALTVSEAVAAGADALLLTTAGDITLGAGLTAGGRATVIAAAGVAQNADIAAAGDVNVAAAGGDAAMLAGTSSRATGSGADVRYAATRDVALGSLTAADAVSVVAGRDITDADADETANVTALRARLVAGGSIGAGTGAASDANPAAVDLAVGNVEATAVGDLYLQSLNAVTVGGVGDVGSSYARFGSGATSLTDLDRTGVSAGTGAAKLKSAGELTVSEAVAAGADALLLTTAGDITLGAGLTAGGRATVIAAAGVAQSADIAAGGDVYVAAAGGDAAMLAGTSSRATGSGADVRYAASRDVKLASLTAADAASVVAGRDITDANGDETANVTAPRVRLVAGGSIGSAADVVNTAIDIEAVHAEAVAGGNIHLRSQGTITVGGVGDVAVGVARFASGASTSTDADLPGIVAGGDFTATSVNGSIVQTPDSAVTAGGDTVLTALNGDIVLENALNDFGGQFDAAALNVGLRDANDLRVGRVEATGGGHVRLTAGGSLLGNGVSPNVVAGTAELYAGRDIGAPFYLDVGRIDEARAGRDIHLVEVSGDMNVWRQAYAGRNLRLDVLGGGIVDGDGDGYVRPGDVTVYSADLYAGGEMFLTADFVGSLGEPVELIARGPLSLDSHLQDAARGSGGYVWAVINGSVGSGPEDVRVGKYGASVPGVVIYNGQMVSGPWWVVRQYQLAQRSLGNRDQANLLDSGIIQVPWFLHPEMSLLSRDAVRDDLRSPEVKRVTGLEEEPGAEDEPDGVVIGVPVAKIR